MECRLQCTICGSTSAKYCGKCRSAAYCSPECQQTDWRTHKPLCSGFREYLTARPSPSHYLAIYFPMRNNGRCKPQLRWLDTKETPTGFVAPELGELFQIPGCHPALFGRGLQIVRGNLLRGRPKFPDSLNIRYLTEYDGSNAVKVNATLHGGTRCVCLDGLGETFWKGPVVAYLKAGADFDAAKMADMSLAAYRDAVDYLAYYRETVGSMIDPVGGANDHYGNVIMGSRVGKVKGVRINCLGDQQPDGDDDEDNPAGARPEFEQVDVPKAHPLFTLAGDDPLEISERLGASWATYGYMQGRWRRDDPDAQEGARNPNAKMLMRQISRGLLGSDRWAVVPEGRLKWTTGSILLVDREKADLYVREVRAVCRLLEERVEPLLASKVEGDDARVLDALKEEVLEQYMQEV